MSSDVPREGRATEQASNERDESHDNSAVEMYDTVDFSPDKGDIYTAIKADVDVEEAFLELGDNVIDNWERVSNKTDPLKMEIFRRTTDDGEEEVVVRDNSGGVERDELDMLFGLGKSAKDDIDGSVGAYGVGMKKAILRLGDEATVATRHKGAPEGYGFTIDLDWLDEETWERPVEGHEVPPGVTEIRLRQLNFNPSSKFDDLKETLAATYEIFLGGGPRPDVQDYDFELRVENETLSADGNVNWSYPPFDGLHPRQFRDIELDSQAASEPVKLHVTVGLLQTADVNESGTDVFIQNRKVHSGAKDEQGGFGVDHRLGQFEDSRHKRLKIIVELETDGDARDLPWSSSKNTLDIDSPIAQQAFNWVARIAQNYYKATYQAVPQTLLRPYSEGHPHASIGDLGTDAYDFSTQSNVTQPYKPSKGFPTATQIQNLAEAHARLGIVYPGGVADDNKPAYMEHWQSVFERRFEEYFDEVGVHPVSITSDPGISVGDISQVVDEIDTWAERDARAGRRYDDLEVWQEARYDATLRHNLPEEADPGDLPIITDRPESEDDGDSAPGEDGPEDEEEEADGADEDPDRTERTVAPTPDQEAMFDEVLDLESGFAEATPAERADVLEAPLERLRRVMQVAGATETTADD